MGNKYTEAQAKATKKYLRKQVSMSYRVKEEEKERYARAAKKLGISLRAFVFTSMDERIEREGL